MTKCTVSSNFYGVIK